MAQLLRLSGKSEDSAHAVDESRPAFTLARELLASLDGELVIPRLSILLGGPPCGTQPAVLLHTMQRRIQRSLFDAEKLRGHIVDSRHDRVAMEGPGCLQ